MATNNAINTPLITLGGAFTMSGAFTFTGTVTANTSVTFPTSGTLLSTTTYPAAGANIGKIIISDGTNWIASTPTFANTYAVSTILYASSADAVTGLATVNRAALSTNATGVPTWLALTNGQIVIGSTAGAPAAATLTAGTGITIGTGSNSITINATGSGMTITEVTGTSASMAVNNGYIASNAGLVTLTLPDTAAVGDTVAIIGKGAGGWSIAQNAGETIHFNSSNTTTGVGGSLASTQRYNCCELMCITANTDWVVVDASGTLTVV